MAIFSRLRAESSAADTVAPLRPSRRARAGSHRDAFDDVRNALSGTCTGERSTQEQLEVASAAGVTRMVLRRLRILGHAATGRRRAELLSKAAAVGETGLPRQQHARVLVELAATSCRSERRAAERASGGWMTGQIAAELFVTLKAVQFHFRRARRKVVIRSAQSALARVLSAAGAVEASAEGR